MAFATVRTLWHLARGHRGADHQSRLENFYGPQASDYDRFREKLLHGRQALIEQLPLPAGAQLAEFGGGTGRNLEFFGERLRQAEAVDLVDLCGPLLAVATERCRQAAWHNVHVQQADVTTFETTRRYDCIYFSYSLSMIPDWWRAIDRAMHLLKPGGRIGVVDFHISRAHPAPGQRRHGALTRALWPLWFRRDGVHLREDLLPYLQSVSQQEVLSEARGRLPLTPCKVPYLIYIGRRPA